MPEREETGTAEPSRVLLVVPPFHSLRRPSIAAGLLAAGLQRNGIACDVRYLNLDFAAFAGQELYEQVPETGYVMLLGEWLFGSALFGSEAPDAERYVEDLLFGRYANVFTRQTVDRLVALRARVPAFLDEILPSIAVDRYAVVGATSMFQQHCAALALLRRVKATHPEVTTILGGANCEGEMGQATLDLFPFVDYVCSGEGDRLFPTVITSILEGRPTPRLPGLLTRSELPMLDGLAQAPMVRDLDRLPYPTYDDYFVQLPARLPTADFRPMLVLETSRGCWWGEKHHCTFCGLNGQGMQYRVKSPDRALAELDYLVERHQTRTVQVTDNILDLSYLDTFLSTLAERDEQLTLFYETKANLTRAQLQLLARAGVRYFQPGVESLSTPILRLMDKGISALQNVRLLKWCAEIGMRPVWYVLFGFPGEEPHDYEQMAELMPSLAHLEPPAIKAKIWLDRFSPYFTRADEAGFVNVCAMQPYGYVYPFAQADLDRLAYHFDYDYADGRVPRTYAQPALDAVDAWRAAHKSARLRIRHTEVGLELHDTRPATVWPLTILKGTARLAYLSLDDGKSVRGVQQALAAGPDREVPSAQQIETWLAEWLDARLVMREGPRYLSLALDPRRRIPRTRPQPPASEPSDGEAGAPADACRAG